ncbi:hypothetical protein [Nocardia sp. NPDC059239]|uniref:hypothetical protein n=1 Tax=unclassified Nocardia TaxID=2637762 RepID=UPI0036BC17DB
MRTLLHAAVLVGVHGGLDGLGIEIGGEARKADWLCPCHACGMAAGAVEMFERHRARLLGLAYRMLGSAADAEDIPMACHGIAAIEEQSWTRL